MKINITTDVSWYTLLNAIDRLANKIVDNNPNEFSIWDAERLEAVARLIRTNLIKE